jgi:hypothetical protein
MLTRTGLAVIAAMALSASAAARADPTQPLNCPSVVSEARMTALERQVGSLEQQLDRLDDKLDQLSDRRRAALDEAKDRIEAIVRDQAMSPEQRDREVARALNEAQSKGQAAAVASQALQPVVADIKGRIETLRQQMRTRASHPTSKDDDAG